MTWMLAYSYPCSKLGWKEQKVLVFSAASIKRGVSDQMLHIQGVVRTAVAADAQVSNLTNVYLKGNVQHSPIFNMGMITSRNVEHDLVHNVKNMLGYCTHERSEP